MTVNSYMKFPEECDCLRTVYLAGLKEREFLRAPVLTPSTIEMSVAMERAIECATIRSRRAFLKQLQQTGLAQEQWRQCAGWVLMELK